MYPNQSVPLFREESIDEYRQHKTEANALVYGTIGYLAGRNFYRRYQGRVIPAALLGASIRHGALCAIRWKIWAFTVLTWTFLTLFLTACAVGWIDMTLEDLRLGRNVSMIEYWFGTITNARLTLLLHLILGVFSVGTTYVQCVRLSGFKRRRFYWVMWPFEAVVRRIPWFLLHTLVVIPFIIMWSHWYYLYN
jgi:hypothetical protein